VRVLAGGLGAVGSCAQASTQPGVTPPGSTQLLPHLQGTDIHTCTQYGYSIILHPHSPPTSTIINNDHNNCNWVNGINERFIQ